MNNMEESRKEGIQKNQFEKSVKPLQSFSGGGVDPPTGTVERILHNLLFFLELFVNQINST